MKLDSYLTLYTIINSKCSKDLNITSETIKLLEELRQKVFDIDLGNFFLDMTPRAQTMKANIDKWGCIKVKSLCRAKKVINKIKREHTEWEKSLQTIYMIRG